MLPGSNKCWMQFVYPGSVKDDPVNARQSSGSIALTVSTSNDEF